MLGSMKQMQYDTNTLISNYWGGQVNNASVTSSTMSVADSDYIYMYGTFQSGLNAYIIKFNNYGVVQWSLNASSTFKPSLMRQDSTYLYLVGNDTHANGGGTNFNCGRLLQINKSDGSVVAGVQQNLTTQSQNNIFSDLELAPNGSITIGQTQPSTSTGYEGIVNITGTTTNWTAQVYNVDQQVGYGFIQIAIDSSNNNYTLSRSSGVTGNAFPIVTKIDSSGTYQWGRQLSSYNLYSPATSAIQNVDIKVDSSANIYVLLTLNLSGSSATAGIGLVKYNSSGVVQWQRQINQANLVAQNLYIDSSDNIYLSGSVSTNLSAPFNERPFIARYDTSGVLQWQRIFIDNTNTTTNNPAASSVTTNPSGNVIVGIDGGLNNSSVNLAMTNFKLPPDGSLGGTYVVGNTNWTYTTSTYVETTGNLANLTYTQSSIGSLTNTNISSNTSIGFTSIGAVNNITYIGS